jgi:putative sugar O-methyltransferase
MEVIVFGVGAASIGIENECALYGFNIVAFIDNNESLWQERRNNKLILSPEKIIELDYERIFITSALYFEEMKKQLLGYGVEENKIFATRDGSLRWTEGCNSLFYRKNSVNDSGDLETELHGYSIGGLAVDDVDTEAEQQTQYKLVEKLMLAYKTAEEDLKAAPEPYQVGINWKSFLKSSRPDFYTVINNDDLPGLSDLLANFFRNDLSSGIFGGQAGFEDYLNNEDMVSAIRHHFLIWSYSIGSAPVHELASPHVGNPFGHFVNGHIVHPNTFLNHYRGHYAKKLIGEINRPVIAEIGGGYGGFGYFAVKLNPGSCYINFDLPENLMIASYFMSLCFPELKVYLYSGDEDIEELISNYDIIMMPHFSLSELPDSSVDLFLNTISLSEMSYSTIVEYFKHIQRATRRFFYHENMITNGMGYPFFPLDTFPELKGFQELSRQPSRWPFFSVLSTQHCHIEQLFIKQDSID